MLKKITLKKTLIAIFVMLLISQFIRIDKTNRLSDPKNHILINASVTPEIIGLLQTSCYDCHSNEAKYPWYTNIAPVSWWIKNHINEGRRHLNFSEWQTYSSKKKDHKLKECVEMLEEGEMPMNSYTLIHTDAKLSKQQQLVLINWFQSMRTHESD